MPAAAGLSGEAIKPSPAGENLFAGPRKPLCTPFAVGIPVHLPPGSFAAFRQDFARIISLE